jgi:hypothetical protein
MPESFDGAGGRTGERWFGEAWRDWDRYNGSSDKFVFGGLPLRSMQLSGTLRAEESDLAR